MKTLDELRKQIEETAPTVDTPEGRYSHNIVSLCLAQIEKECGRAEANKAIRDFDLEALGWFERQEEDEDENPV